MDSFELHRIATWTEIGLGVATFIALWFLTAPYGRHARKGFGPAIPQRLGWVLMELPAVAAWGAIYAFGDHRAEAAPLVMIGLWMLHYVQRTFIFPFIIRAEGKTTPIGIVVSAIVFNLLNAYVNARWVSQWGTYSSDWLTSPQFIVGTALFLGGYWLNRASDSILFRLRRQPGEYRIPEGGAYRWVSCPNYLGEIIEWIGWAILTWSLAGTAFAIYTAANLVPRAVSNHRWYKERFAEYPSERRALVPFVF